MANVAWALATHGEKVLTIDWDLEAPGLHRYFHPFLEDPGQAKSPGLIDYLWGYISNLTSSPQERFIELDPGDLVQELQLPVKGAGLLHFIGAGVQDDHYSEKVGGLDWGTFYSRFGGEAFLTKFMAWARLNYTHILIDSRTGVADSAGVCTMQLPDLVVICMVYNRQSIEGTAAVASSIIRGRRERKMPEADIWVVPSRVEDRNAIASARLHCVKLLKESIRADGNLAAQLRASEIKHYPWCSFEEKLAVFEEVPGDNGSLLQGMHRLASRIAGKDLNPVEVDNNLLMTYWRRAAFEDPRLAELELLSNASDSEAVYKLVHWLDEAFSEALSEKRPKIDWISALGLASVKQANALGEIDGRVAQVLSDQGFELLRIAYEHDPRGNRDRFSFALQARADFLQRAGRLEEALQHTQHAIKLLGTRSVSAPWKRARALERLAELTTATRGAVAALPIYEEMASLFKKMDAQVLPAVAIDDAFRAKRLLAEAYVQLEQHHKAFNVIETALDEMRHLRPVLKRPSPEAATLLGLYAEIGSVLFPEEEALRHLLTKVKDDALLLLDSPTLTTNLERKLSLVESGAYVRRNRMNDALTAIEKWDRHNVSKPLSADPQLDETLDAQVELRFSANRFSEARKLLGDRIRLSTRAPSARLCELILRYVTHTGDPQPLFDLVLKRAGSGALDLAEQKMLSQLLLSSKDLIDKDKTPVLHFLQHTLKHAAGRESPPPAPKA
jgi:tetratricopeptide (TPR) repeat protein